MELNYFKDMLFDVLNESEILNISDIESNERKNTFTLFMADGSIFEIECKRDTAANHCTFFHTFHI